MPISLEMVEQRLLNRGFANLTELESFVKRMVCNAKDWYSRRTLTYEDAERVRKALSNYMTALNPAYKNIPKYTATPTPLPPSPNDDVHAVTTQTPVTMTAPVEMSMADQDANGGENDTPQTSNAPTPLTIPKRRVPARPSTPESVTPTPTSFQNIPYRGLTFQQAQEKILEEAIRRKDDEYALAFFFLPQIRR